MLKKYLKVWWLLASNNFGTLTQSRLDFFSYLFGKIIRFVFYLVFLISLTSQSKMLAGYSRFEVLLFFLVFNLVDIITQMFLRGTYAIGHQLVGPGKFDYVLIQPLNPLFRSLSNIIDLIDFSTLLPIIPLLGWVIFNLPVKITLVNLLVFLALILNGLIVALSFHILAAAVAVITRESHFVMFTYRNLLNMVRFPIDIYGPTLQFILTVFIPVGVMIAFPVKTLLGELKPHLVLYAFLIGGLFLLFSLYVWKLALQRYQSLA